MKLIHQRNETCLLVCQTDMTAMLGFFASVFFAVEHHVSSKSSEH